MSCGVTILPAAPPRPSLNYDRFQFDHRAIRVSAETRLTFQDAVHTTQPGTFRVQRWKPAFANNAEQLRKVIALVTWQSARGGKIPMPKDLENDLPRLKRLAKARLDNRWHMALARDQKRKRWHHKTLSKRNKEIIARHIFTESWAGGSLQILATIAYLSWQRGLTSCEVAEQLYMSAPNVRIIRYRLCNAARKLGFETFVPHHSRRHFSR
jgi:hypothetical protein